MSLNPAGKQRRWAAHTRRQALIDRLGWPHQRPARDIRLVLIHISMMWVACGQAIFGPPDNSAQSRAGFDTLSLILFGVLLSAACVLYLIAAFCKSQYDSFGYEAAACFGFAGFLSAYAATLIVNTPYWWLTYNAPFTLALAVGNAVRFYIVIRIFVRGK